LDAAIETDHGTVLGRTPRSVEGRLLHSCRSEPLTINARCRVRLALVFSENQFSEQLELDATRGLVHAATGPAPDRGSSSRRSMRRAAATSICS